MPEMKKIVETHDFRKTYGYATFYKKKVNPDLVVDLKPSLRQRRLADERAKR